MVRFLADASLHYAVVTGCARREPAIDFLSAQSANHLVGGTIGQSLLVSGSCRQRPQIDLLVRLRRARTRRRLECHT